MKQNKNHMSTGVRITGDLLYILYFNSGIVILCSGVYIYIYNILIVVYLYCVVVCIYIYIIF